jgi:putative ABC transport system substrate-binding protein
LAPDVIHVFGTTAFAAAAGNPDHTIVFAGVSDPVGQGFVASLAHPGGGNITGFTDWDSTMGSKFLELLNGIAPGVVRVAVSFSPKIYTVAYNETSVAFDRGRGPCVRGEGERRRVHDVPEMELAIVVAGREPNGGLIVLTDVFTTAHSELITALAARHRLPAVYPLRLFVRSGGLLSRRLRRAVPTGGGLHRSHPQGCEAGRPTRSATNQILSPHQSKNREGTWPYGPTVAAHPGRRSDRMKRQQRGR